MDRSVAEALSGAAEGIPMRSDRSRRLASRENKLPVALTIASEGLQCSIPSPRVEKEKREEGRGLKLERGVARESGSTSA